MSRYLKNSGRTNERTDERTTGRKPIIIELAAAEAAAKKPCTVHAFSATPSIMYHHKRNSLQLITRSHRRQKNQRMKLVNECILSYQMPKLYLELDNIVTECVANFTRLKRFDLICHQAFGDEKCFVKPIVPNYNFGEYAQPRQASCSHNLSSNNISDVRIICFEGTCVRSRRRLIQKMGSYCCMGHTNKLYQKD